MSGVVVVMLIVAGLCLAGGIGYLLWKQEQERRAAWAAWADQRGWTYRPDSDRNVADYFGFVDRFQRGRNRYATDIFRGSWRKHPATAFSYHYETRSQDSDGNQKTSHYWLWLVAIQLERAFPELRIAPEHAGKRFLHLFSGNDIDFESVEFSRAFEVQSADKRFAYDFCNSSMIEYLLANRDWLIELEGPWLVTYGTGKLKLEHIEPALTLLGDLRRRMPDYLFR